MMNEALLYPNDNYRKGWDDIFGQQAYDDWAIGLTFSQIRAIQSLAKKTGMLCKNIAAYKKLFEKPITSHGVRPDTSNIG
jgi:hypothetical protein